MFIEYLEHGLGLIPVYGKQPSMKEWQKFCHELPSEEQAALWDKFDSNFGMPCGPANNVIWIDIDTEDPKLFAIVPPSPVRKRGRKGESRAFQYRDYISAEKIYSYQDGKKSNAPHVEILSVGNQTVLPPSIHPETKEPYIWLTPDQFPTFKTEDLPVLTQKDIENIRKYLQPETQNQNQNVVQVLHNDDPLRKSPHGAHNQIRTVCAAILAECLPVDEAVQKLLEADNRLHKPVGYFSEFNRTSDQKSDPYSNAHTFYMNMMKSVNRERLKRGEEPYTPKGKLLPSINISELLRENTTVVNKMVYPEARGFMKTFQQACSLMSHGDQDALSLGSSIALMGVLVSNKFNAHIAQHTVTPNVYVLNIGHSGFGKELSQRLITELLAESGLVGSFLYRSGTSMIQDLPWQRERIDIIDEASVLLSSINSKNLWQREIGELLCALYSKANGKFLGVSYADPKKKGRKQENVGACWNPHISILASTNPTGFKESVSSGMQSKGLLPRFLVFIQDLKSNYKAVTEENVNEIKQIKVYLQSKINEFLAIQKIANESDNLLEDTRYIPVVLPFTEESKKAFFDMAGFYFEKSKQDPDNFESAFYQRLAEQACKLALLDALSLDRRVIEIDSFLWGKEVAETQWKNSRALYQLTSASNQQEANVLKVLDIIQKVPFIKQRDLTRRTQFLRSDERTKIVQDLLNSGQIEQFEIEGMGKTGQKTSVLKFANNITIL